LNGKQISIGFCRQQEVLKACQKRFLSPWCSRFSLSFPLHLTWMPKMAIITTKNRGMFWTR
jgi:hypothetical protein